MMRRLIAMMALLPALAFAAEPTARGTIEQFYRSYLPALQGEPPFSKGFAALIATDKALCAKYNPDEVCGFGADGDPYLNAQEYDSGMTFENTGATVTETAPGLVLVTLNVYPSDTDGGDFYEREIRYRLIREQGAWVVDDMIFDEGMGMREGLAFEINAIREEQASKGNPI